LEVEPFEAAQNLLKNCSHFGTFSLELPYLFDKYSMFLLFFFEPYNKGIFFAADLFMAREKAADLFFNKFEIFSCHTHRT
jgi:hypothetical protein